MSPKPRVKPYFYWSICSLIFFLFWGCNFVNERLKIHSKSDFQTPILYTKNPKKPNPRFFADGSSTHYFLELEPQKRASLVAKWEINFFVYEKDFTNSLKESYKQENFYTYKLTWKRREGILDPGSNSLYLKLNYNSIELGEVETNSLSELLNQINFFPAKKTAINEYDIYNIGKDSAWLAEEGMTGSDGASYIWRSEQGMMDTTSPNTKFLSFAHSKESSNYTSTNYDYTKNKWEVIPSNPDKLFYKPIYSDSKTEIFFVPPYANSSSSQTKEPVGFKRIGNFLLKEDVK